MVAVANDEAFAANVLLTFGLRTISTCLLILLIDIHLLVHISTGVYLGREKLFL